MLESVQLSLLLGPGVPAPAPRLVLDALAGVEVTVTDVGTSGFQFSLSIDKQSPLQVLFLLTGGSPLLFMRVVLVATVNGVANVLVDGVITSNNLAPGDKGSNSTLTLTGEDLTALMNQSNQSGIPFPASSSETRVAQILAKYAMFGVVPVIIPSIMMDQSQPNDIVPSQQGTDLAYIKKLAANVGYVFYLDPGPLPGMSRAYWGPQVKVGPVQPALSADMDAYTNVESLTFSFDQQKNKNPSVFVSNPATGASQSTPLPPFTALNPSLGGVAPLATNIIGDLQPVRSDLGKLPSTQAIMIGMAAAAQLCESVTADGTLDVTRYGGVLKPRQLVGVRGSGPVFDGLYYVKSVTHKIKRSEYKQEFKLSRNGLVSTVATVAA